MKKLISTIIAIIMLMIASFNMGKSAGIDHAINNAVITNENRDQGNYIMEVKGKVFEYWYE